MKHPFAKTALLALPLIAGCAEMPQNMPLVFAETISVGIGVGATTVDQGASFNLGFQSKDVAIVPIISYDKAGNAQPMRAENDQTTAGGGSKSQDAFSVIGTFSSDTSGNTKTVGLGKFFATGTAAQRLADGFSKCLAAGTCDGPATTPTK